MEDLLTRQRDDPAYSINHNPEYDQYDNITKMQIMKRKEYEYRLFLDINRAKIQKRKELKMKREAEIAERRRQKEEEDRIRKEKLRKRLESVRMQYESFKEKTRLAKVLWKISEQYELLKIRMATNVKIVGISLILAVFLLVIIFLIARSGTDVGSNFNLGQFINAVKLKFFQQHKWKTWSIITLIVAFFLLEFIQKINGIWNSKNIDLLRTTEVFEDLMIGKVAFLLGVPPVLIPKDIIYVVDEVYRARYKKPRKPKNNSN